MSRDVGRFGCFDPRSAGRVASVAVAVGAGPLEHPERDHPVGPGGVGLEAVVEPAQGAEVVARGGAGLFSAFGVCVGVVLGDVVEIAAAGRT